MLNTSAKYDNPIIKGTGLRAYYRFSYCKKSTVVKCFDDLMKNANFNYIFFKL